jgi:hypothetical protein
VCGQSSLLPSDTFGKSTSGEGTGKVQGRYREGTGKVQGSRQTHSGRAPPAKIQGRYREGTGKVQGRYREASDTFGKSTSGEDQDIPSAE